MEEAKSALAPFGLDNPVDSFEIGGRIFEIRQETRRSDPSAFRPIDPKTDVDNHSDFSHNSLQNDDKSISDLESEGSNQFHSGPQKLQSKTTFPATIEYEDSRSFLLGAEPEFFWREQAIDDQDEKLMESLGVVRYIALHESMKANTTPNKRALPLTIFTEDAIRACIKDWRPRHAFFASQDLMFLIDPTVYKNMFELIQLHHLPQLVDRIKGWDKPILLFTAYQMRTFMVPSFVSWTWEMLFEIIFQIMGWDLKGTGLTNNNSQLGILDSVAEFGKGVYDCSIQGRIARKGKLQEWCTHFKIYSFDEFRADGTRCLIRPSVEEATNVRLLMCKLFGYILFSSRQTQYFRRVYDIVFNVMGLDTNPDVLKCGDKRTDITFICEYLALFYQQEHAMVEEDRKMRQLGAEIKGSFDLILQQTPTLYLPPLDGVEWSAKESGAPFAGTRLGKQGRIGAQAQGSAGGAKNTAQAAVDTDVKATGPSNRQRKRAAKQGAETGPTCSLCNMHFHDSSNCRFKFFHPQAIRCEYDPEYMEKTIKPQLALQGLSSLSAFHTSDGKELVLSAEEAAVRKSKGFNDPASSRGADQQAKPTKQQNKG